MIDKIYWFETNEKCAGDGFRSILCVCAATVTILVRVLPKSTCCEPDNCVVWYKPTIHNKLNKKYTAWVYFLFNWLREMDLFRFASLAADFCALHKPALSNRLILALNHLSWWFKPNTTHIFNKKKHPQGMLFC